MHGKLNINIFEAYEKQVASDRSREYWWVLPQPGVSSAQPRKKEENEVDMKEKATVQKIEEMKSLLEKNQQINFSEREKLSKRLDTLKAEHEE